MKWCAFLLGAALWAAPPLQVVSVGRVGLPPYDGSEKVYRLEGDGCATLRVGEPLLLRRAGERRSLGRLEILAVHLDHAEARLVQAGETFPLKGDLAIRLEAFLALPQLPAPVQALPLPPPASLQPLAITRVVPRSMGQATTHREAIFFIKGDASLSPGARNKLQAWVESWGIESQWSLECPQGIPSALAEERIAALRSELRQLGISSLEIKPIPEESAGRYDAIYVMSESW